ncbi:uncharacterized protein STEHIDRAFT_147751 [Stereum hirsutum FP-91666 SS1]|uniref:uncharacterized protein n=1 Tax=Stereum hirsutum (strain FP-91666) TaxID=721885 RepID=UPI0004449446|nr:uncharacterized protein STEHIDRAFT_147751 [Stereum hirsutum FP-91666 SS1]EIM85271.1 hypothetical protein STEHIDRAFT_147751 [Stereum hirsutum FP-91666 SS1]
MVKGSTEYHSHYTAERPIPPSPTAVPHQYNTPSIRHHPSAQILHRPHYRSHPFAPSKLPKNATTIHCRPIKIRPFGSQFATSTYTPWSKSWCSACHFCRRQGDYAGSREPGKLEMDLAEALN